MAFAVNGSCVRDDPPLKERTADGLRVRLGMITLKEANPLLASLRSKPSPALKQRQEDPKVAPGFLRKGGVSVSLACFKAEECGPSGSEEE